MLITKFKKKYGEKNPGFIDKEGENFMKAETLTEANLQKLDERIRKKAEGDYETQSVKSHHSVPKSKGTPSVCSISSKKSSQKRSNIDTISVTSSQVTSSSYMPDDDEDEWAQILEHDTLLYREEERARLRRENENKAKLKRELDRQLGEKEIRKNMEGEENNLYEDAQRKNVDMMEEREKMRDLEYKEKIMQEK